MGKSVGPLNLNNVLIAPNYRKSDWVKAKTADDWPKMVDIFNDRIEGPVSSLTAKTWACLDSDLPWWPPRIAHLGERSRIPVI